MDLERLFWDPAGNRMPRPAGPRRRGRALVEARHVWLMARQRGAKSRADLAHLFQDFLRVLGILDLTRRASGFRKRRPAAYRGARCGGWCKRSASSSASSQGRLVEGRWASAAARQGSSAHAPEAMPARNRQGSHLFEQLRRVFLSIWTIWRAFFLCASPSSLVRPPTKISVLFLKDLDAALQLLTAPSLTVALLLKQSSMLPHHLQLR